MDALRRQRRNAEAALRRVTLQGQSTRIPQLSPHQLRMALIVWWEGDRLMCLGLRYLEWHFLCLCRRGAAAGSALVEDPALGAARLSLVPAPWQAALAGKVTALTAEEEARLACPPEADAKYHRRARGFLEEIALVDFVRGRNEVGLVVSTRALLHQRDLFRGAVQPLTHRIQSPLPKSGRNWVDRFLRYHGLNSGRFRVGSGLSEVEQCTKVRVPDRDATPAGI